MGKVNLLGPLGGEIKNFTVVFILYSFNNYIKCETLHIYNYYVAI